MFGQRSDDLGGVTTVECRDGLIYVLGDKTRQRMCREMKREPAWVAAIRCALLDGEVTVEAVMVEANLIDGWERTVEDILTTMVDRDLLRPAPGDGERYLPGRVLLDSNRHRLDFSRASDGGAHRWRSTG